MDERRACASPSWFGDHWRFGLPMLGLFFVVAVFLVPLIWSF